MKKLSILFAALLATTLSFAATYTYTFEKTTLGQSGTIDLGGVTWSQSAEGKWYAGYDATKGQQIGSKNNVTTMYSLTTSDILGTITEVKVNASMAASGGAKMQVKVGETAFIAQTALTDAAKDYTGTGSAQGAVVISFTNTAKAFYIKSITITYTADADAVAKPTFTPAATDFVGSATVTLTAGEGLDIYYTLDGTEPTTVSTKYAEPFTLTATTTVKAIAYNATTKKASEVAEKTYTKQVLMTCAEVNAAKQSAFVALNKVTVVYVNGGNIYVKDETGYALIFAYDFGLKAGQVVEGLQGTMDIYNNLPEVKPSVALADLTITEGTIPEPELQTTVPTMADINKYVRIENVTLTAAEWKNSDKTAAARTLVAKLGEEDLTLYNTFKIDQTFEAKNYNIVGFVTCYKTTMQIAVISAEEVKDEPITPATWYSQESISGTLDGKDVKYAITYEITRNADKTLTIKMNLNDEAAAVVGMVPQIFIAGTYAGNFNNGEFTTSTTYTDGDVLEMWFYMAYEGRATTSAHFNYTVGSSNNKPTALDATVVAPKATKRLINGVLVIEKDGVLYTAQGAKL